MNSNKDTADRVRQVLASKGAVNERMMFGALGFMLNGKLAICVGKDDVMFKVGPEIALAKLDAGEAEPVAMNNRTMKNWVVVKNEILEDSDVFDDLASAATSYNLVSN